MLWLEKYQPKTFEECTTHNEVISLLKTYSLENVPNLIFHGNSGFNKKTLMYSLFKHLYGEYPLLQTKTVELDINSTKMEVSYLESNEMIEINPSEYKFRDRQIIQEIVKRMAETKPIMGYFSKKVEKSIKIIVIDQAEELSMNAQAALRRTMELYSGHFRIIMICSSISKIIDPLRSRSMLVRIRGFRDAEMSDILRNVCNKEDVSMTDADIGHIVKRSENNCKKAICLLEAISFNKENEQKRIKLDLASFQLEWESKIANIVQ